MRNIRLICFGILPILLGLLLNKIYLPIPTYGLACILWDSVLLLLWGWLSFKSFKPHRSIAFQAFLMNSVGLLMLVLIVCQELVIGQYWDGLVGLGTRLYFIPWLDAAYTLISPFISLSTFWQMNLAIWICMFVASYVGFKLKCKKTDSQ